MILHRPSFSYFSASQHSKPRFGWMSRDIPERKGKHFAEDVAKGRTDIPQGESVNGAYEIINVRRKNINYVYVAICDDKEGNHISDGTLRPLGEIVHRFDAPLRKP